MGIFNQKPKFKVTAPTIRKIVVPVETAKKPKLPRDSNSASPRPTRLDVPSGPGVRSAKASSVSPRVSSSPSMSKSLSPLLVSADERTTTTTISNGSRRKIQNDHRKRKLTSRASSNRPSPVTDRVEFGKDSDSEDDDWESALNAREQRKRARRDGSRTPDLNRKLTHPVLLQTLHRGDKESGEPGEPRDFDKAPLQIIHAADVASRALKCVPLLGAEDDEVVVDLQYAGSRHKERYELVWGRDKIDAVKDIKTTVRHTAEVYLTKEQAVPFLDPTAGIVRQLERASSDKVRDVKLFKTALDDFNRRLLALYDDGTIARNVSEMHDLPKDLVAFILGQVYDRTVAPKVDLLRKYENGTDNVYGELLHPFVSSVLVDRLKMTSGQVFVDLGSGVGNVVLQAALEIGCESWGCEMMENACNLADAQKKEFIERCRLWGISAGKVQLERGDFRANAPIQDVLKRADVVLVNNQAFTSQLNDDLVRMFLDFKSGCKIVSLKSFVHDHKSASHNINDVGSTILDVEAATYPEGYVSWTGAAGRFCISTRK